MASLPLLLELVCYMCSFLLHCTDGASCRLSQYLTPSYLILGLPAVLLLPPPFYPSVG